MSNLKLNHLANETSPYLQQHATNPVDWYPWSDEALEKARSENKPILLSIGYAACHWCHVMAHESFEDHETAEIMNQLFVNIKVDREERPDLDKIYQTAHYILTHQPGGWPLTVFLTADTLIPFYSGTYFPLQPRHRLPAFKDVLQTIASLYRNNPDALQQQNAELLKILQHASSTNATQLNDKPIQSAIAALEQQYDAINGGFGQAPKFPQPTRLAFLLQYAPPIVVASLKHMACGGIYDQLSGGFYRYSVDAKWQIPHFEKMLYDNGQLLYLYATAAHIFQDAFLADIARETAEWLHQTMQAPEGAYYASLDADSEGHEGKYYLWDKSELNGLLTSDEYAVFSAYYGFNQTPGVDNKWHLHIQQSLRSIAEALNISVAIAEQRLQSAKKKLLIVRSKRIAPACDTKILTAWNALAIKGMLTTGDLLQDERYIQSAYRALSFIQQKCWVNKRLFANYKDGKTTAYGYLDDYVFLIDALLTALQITWQSEHLQFAIDLTDTVLTHFSDNNGGFYFTADDHESLLYRPKTWMDEAMPSGNGIAVQILLVLGHLLGETRYLDAAEKTLQSAWHALEHYPAEHCALITGLNDYLHPPQMIIIRGHAKEITAWQAVCKTFAHIVFAIPHDTLNLPNAISAKKSLEKTCAYICTGTQCLDVITDINELKRKFSVQPRSK